MDAVDKPSRPFAVLQAIRFAVERIDFDRLPPLEVLADHLEKAADARPRHSSWVDESAEVIREREFFVKAIKQSTASDIPQQTRMPYRRVLADAEVDELWLRIAQKWGVKPGEYWYPLTDRINPFTAGFPLVAVAGPGPCWATVDRVIDTALLAGKVRAFLGKQGVDRLYELREDGESFLLEKTLATFNYNGSEGFWFCQADDWVVYCSHEATMTLAGSIAAIVADIPE